MKSRTPLRGAWIEIFKFKYKIKKFKSRTPLRGAWIEMRPLPNAAAWRAVAPPCGVRGLK